MKKILYYLIIITFAVVGAVSMNINDEYSFSWWIGFINVFCWGGYLVSKLLTYLKD